MFGSTTWERRGGFCTTWWPANLMPVCLISLVALFYWYVFVTLSSIWFITTGRSPSFFPLSLLRFYLGLLHIIDIILIVVSFLALKNRTSFSCRSFIYKKYTTVINDAVFQVFAYFRFVCRQGICFSHLKLCLTLNFIFGYCSRACPDLKFTVYFFCWCLLVMWALAIIGEIF